LLKNLLYKQPREMREETEGHLDIQQIYDRDYFETNLKTASQPYSYDNKIHHCEIILNTLAHLKPKKVLDIGCAKGFLVYLFNQKEIQACGIDVSRYAIENAPDKIKNKLSVVNIENDRFPYEEEYFDLIIGLDMLEHLGSFENMLKECDRVLKRGGYLFFTTPVPRSWDATHDITHINIHPREFWIKLFRQYGFLPLDREFHNSLIREFVKNYKRIISLAPSDRRIIKFLSKFGWIGKFIRRELQVYINFFSPWRVTEILIFKK